MVTNNGFEMAAECESRVLRLGGFALFVGSIALCIYAISAAVGNASYAWAKFGPPRKHLAQSLRLCDRAWRFYPRNYFTCSYAAEATFHASAVHATEKAENLKRSKRWTQRGMRLNRYSRPLNLRWVSHLAREELARAIEHMQGYLEINFWHPYNHVVMAELYALAGEFDRAHQSMYWAAKSEYARSGWRRVNRAQQRYFDSLTPSSAP